MEEGSRVFDISNYSGRDLLLIYANVMDQLRAKSIIQSSNNPVADLSELLVCRALDLKRQRNSAAGYDGEDRDGKRYQIKGRRRTAFNDSCQLSAIRKLDTRPFDFLVAVIFQPNFEIEFAGVVKIEHVLQYCRQSTHVNGHLMDFKPSLWAAPTTTDITHRVRASLESLP
jgi:hypothetical protein